MFQHNKPLAPLTTFGIPATAALYAEYADLKTLLRICRSEEYRNNRVLHIGGGSNLLFMRDFNGLVLHSAIRGLKVYHKNPHTVFLIAGAGEKWTDVVDFAVANNLAGLENMAGIPGEAGAAPVQNVGAYGTEAADVIAYVECLDRLTLKTVTFQAAECGFGYRTSNFKNIWKDRYFVLRVAFRLTPSTLAQNTSYGPLRTLAQRLGHRPTIAEVRSEVLSVRSAKLPDVQIIGSAGSFFTNPVMRKRYYEYEVLNLDPSVPHYPAPAPRDVRDADGADPATEYVKVPAGWLIEQAGLKGARVGGAYIYPHNCLVIANDGTATAADVAALAEMVRKEVNRRFHIPLHPEVNRIDSAIEITVLGSGTSKGVPELCCDCAVCSSENPQDHRLRASVMVRTMGLTILIDASPDFRMQALRQNLQHIDAILLTHEHYDHVGGIDDLRPYCFFKPLRMYARSDCTEHLRKRLDYCFAEHRYPGVPSFRLTEIENRPFIVDGLEITPVEVLHGSMPIYGYRIGKFAYITDAKHIAEEEKEKLRGLDVLIVNALRQREHFAHFTVAEALALIDELQPRQAYLTHLCHETGLHAHFAATLPPNVAPIYDGQKIVVL